MLRSRADRPRAGRPAAAATLAAALLALVVPAPPAEALDVTSPDWSVNGTKLYGDLGWCVATAGDVNGDGYSDVLVTEPFGDPDYLGTVYLYYGSPTGPSTPADWTSSGAAGGDEYGYSAATGGDINGDGYDDFVIGIRSSDVTTTNGGAIEVWYGSAGGPQAGPVIAPSFGSARFGSSVAFAGDVNGDGYHDVIVGAPNWSGTGSAWVYVGGAAGLFQNPTRILTGAQSGMELGISVAGAGDVNADGYDDVLVGAHRNDSLLQTDNGRAFLYLGNSSGVDAASQWSALGIGTDTFFGRSVAPAGDVNGDGYADVLIGEPGWDNGQTDEGAMHVYLGSSVGLASGVPPWVTLESDVGGAQLGYSVAVAGDVNGDGFPDLVGGGPFQGSSQGWVGVWRGAGAGPQVLSQGTLIGAGFLGYSVAPAGDVNGDGFGDLAVGAPLTDFSGTDNGWAGLYFGGGELPARASAGATPWSMPFGTNGSDVSIACAGDLNGDGYDDLVLGDPAYQNDGGRVVIHYGRPNGIVATEDWEIVASNGTELGASVASAGDVNGDGYADLIVSEAGVDAVFFFHGSPTGPTSGGSASGSNFSELGRSVSAAGDVNGDGYGDVVLGAPGPGAGSGLAEILFGSPSGLDTSNPDYVLLFDVFQDPDLRTGESVAGVGDLNGDGFDDVLVGAPHAGTGTDSGAVWVELGGPADGFVVVGDPTVEGFGYRVAAAGDVNGDGYADALISAYVPGSGADGQVWLFHGTASGLDSGTLLAGQTPHPAGTYGSSIAGVGDVDGDGLSDLIAGDEGYQIGTVSLWRGPDPGAQPLPWLETRGFGFGRSVGAAGDLNGDGFADFAAWNSSALTIDVYYGGGHLPGGPDTVPPPLRRQMRITGEPVALGGLTQEKIVRFQADAASPAGRVDVRMELQVQTTDVPFGASQLAGWQDPGPVIGGRPAIVQGLEPTLVQGEDYRWRMRILSRHPFFPQGPWMSNAPSVPTLKHFRVGPAVGTGAVIAGEDPPGHDGIERIGPNPFRTASTIEYAVARRGHVRLDVVDVTGRRIATLVDRAEKPGAHRVTWSGRDAAGRAVAAGVYFARLEAGGEVATRKIVRLR